MAKDINIHVKATGAARTKQQLDRVGKSAQQVGSSVGGGAKKGAEGMGKLSRSAASTKNRFGKLKSSITSWIVGAFGLTAAIGGITKAIRIQAQAIKEHAQVAAEQQKKLLALQAMGSFFEEHPEARKEVASYAEFGRRPFEDVATAWYSVESKGAGLTEEQKKGIMLESLELGRMEPEADLTSIVDMFSLYAKETREKDINLIQNVIRTTMTKAGAELSDVGKYLPQFQSLGISAGLSGAEAAGLWAYATTRTGQPEKATVGLRNIFMALQGKGTPESQELLKQLSITPEMGFYEQMGRLSAQQKAGKFGLPEAETIAMKENAALLLSMLTDTQAMMQTVWEVSAAARPDIDIVKEKLDQIMGQDEIARIGEERQQLDIAIQNLKGQDIKALRWDTYLKEIEETLRKQDIPEWIIRYQLARESIPSLLGEEAPTIPFPGLSRYLWKKVEQGAPAVENIEQRAPSIVNYNYHNETIYTPRIGSDERGPRYSQD